MMKLFSVILVTAILCSLQQVQCFTKMSYIAFVVDDTGSMSNEIADVKSWLENCAKGMYEQCSLKPDEWILSPFNDPDTGPVTGPTKVRSEIVNAIEGLRAHEGGDCPEMAMEGIMNALNEISPFNVGCKIFFITDASAKDNSKLEEVKKELLRKNCDFNPVLTGCCDGGCKNPCDVLPPSYCDRNIHLDSETKRRRRSVVDDGTLTNEGAFYHLAYATGGKIHVLEKSRSSGQLLKYLETEMKIVSCPTDEIAGPLPNGFDESKCRSTKSCWDGRDEKCYCQKRGQCPEYTTTEAPTTASTIPTTMFTPPECTMSPRVTYHVNYSDCSKYYLCYMGRRYDYKCRSGTVFNDVVKYCDSPENVPRCGGT